MASDRFDTFFLNDRQSEQIGANQAEYALSDLGLAGQELFKCLQIMASREKEVYRQNLNIADRLAYGLYSFGVRGDIRLPEDYALKFDEEAKKEGRWPFILIKINMSEDPNTHERKVVSSYAVNDIDPNHDVVWQFDQDIKNGLIQKFTEFIKARTDKDNQMIVDHAEIVLSIEKLIPLPPDYFSTINSKHSGAKPTPPKQGTK